MIKPQLHFSRFEFKYLIDKEQEYLIKRNIEPYLRLDDYASRTLSGCYGVYSLYYDSPKFFYFKQKMEGDLYRKKIRLRAYKNDNQWSDNVFFEIKRRCDSVIIKDRILLLDNDYNDFINHGELNTLEQKIKTEYWHEKRYRNLQPKVLVAYDREPYLGKFHKNLRVTFDKNIKASVNGLPGNKADELKNVLVDFMIMEIKYNGVLPYYMNDVIKNFQLERISYSKYCNGIERCYNHIANLPKSELSSIII